MSSTALVKIGELLPDRPISTVDELRDAANKLEQMRAADLAYVLTPLSITASIKPLHRVSIRVVRIDPTVTKDGNYWKPGPHCYKAKFTGPDEVALNKNGILAIVTAAGGKHATKRLDDHSEPFYAEFRARIYLQDLDGLWREFTGHRAVDLRNGSGEAVNMTPEQLRVARQFVAQNAETKALLRAARGCLGLLHTYRIADLLRKPFIVGRLVQHFDITDPDQKRAAIAQALDDNKRLFGEDPTPREILPDLPDDAPSAGTPPPPVEPPKMAKRTDAKQEAAPQEAPPPPPPADLLDEDLPDFDAPELVVCDCPCGDQREITPEVAEATTEKCGGRRCIACFPGRTFDYERHKDLKTLGLPRWPKLTAEDVRAKWEAAAKAAKK